MSKDVTIAINVQVSPQTVGGVETALNALVKHLGQLDGPERFLLLAMEEYAAEFEPMLSRNQAVQIWPFGQEYGRESGTSAEPSEGCTATAAGGPDALLRGRGVAAVHFPYPLRFETALPFVYEPWDLQHCHYPEFFSPAERAWRERAYRSSCERAALVVTATHATRRDIVARYGVDARQVAVIPRGPLLPPRPATADEVARVRAEHGLPEGFALYPAMTFPHKNHVRLFEALARLRDAHGISLPLVCTGRMYKPHWPAVLAAVDEFGLAEQVRWLGRVDDDTLRALYSAARFMVFPSLFEGLGLPVLEALQYGLPVLASDASCLPEVAGEAALLFDGRDVDAIVDALLTAVRRPEALEAARANGPKVLERFAWPKAAATFVACYRAAAGRPLTAEQQALFAEATAGEPTLPTSRPRATPGASVGEAAGAVEDDPAELRRRLRELRLDTGVRLAVLREREAEIERLRAERDEIRARLAEVHAESDQRREIIRQLHEELAQVHAESTKRLEASRLLQARLAEAQALNELRRQKLHAMHRRLVEAEAESAKRQENNRLLQERLWELKGGDGERAQDDQAPSGNQEHASAKGSRHRLARRLLKLGSRPDAGS